VNRPWIWNLALIVALAVVIARFPSTLSEPPVTLTPVAPPPAREPFALPPPPPPPAEEALREIVDRNLFSPSRGSAEVSTATKPPSPPPVAAAPLKVTLFGVVIEEEGDRYAFLQDASRGGSGRPKKYREGDSFAGAKVKSIRSDRVILETGSREQTVNLRSPKEGIPSVAPTPGPAGAVPGTPSPRPARRVRRPDTVTGSRDRRPVPTRRRSRPAFPDADPADTRRDSGERRTGQIDRGADYYQEEYPGPGDDHGYYYEDEEYGSEWNEETW
jgi:hypothetical protein